MRWRTTTPSGAHARGSRTCPSTAARRPAPSRSSADGLAPSASSMKVAVISDIHGNRQAFEATLEAVAASEAAELWCLGDLVGYGADPDVCVELARQHAAVCLAGNHDLAVTGEIAMGDFSRGASLAAQWTREVIAPENLDFLRGLSPEGQEGPVGLYHASPRDPVWEYVLSTLLAELCLDEQRHRLCLIGHSHVALAFNRRRGESDT